MVWQSWGAAVSVAVSVAAECSGCVEPAGEDAVVSRAGALASVSGVIDSAGDSACWAGVHAARGMVSRATVVIRVNMIPRSMALTL